MSIGIFRYRAETRYSIHQKLRAIQRVSQYKLTSDYADANGNMLNCKSLYVVIADTVSIIELHSADHLRSLQIAARICWALFRH